MDRHTKYNLLAVLAFFCAIITLGGLGNIAAQQHFYWLAFVANLGVYAFLVYKIFKKGQEE